jgi:sarcosine oxidase
MAGSARAVDVLVVGLGAMGSAALYQLAKRGVKALGVDRFHPPHTEGSSHGGSRVTREAAGEGAAYVPLVQRTHAILHALEAEYGESLLVKSGTLIVGSPNGATPLHGENDFFATSLALAERFRIKHELLDADQLRRRYPQFRTIRDTDRGYLEPNSGYIRPEAVIDLQLRAARRHGAETLMGTVCMGIRQADGVVRVATSQGPIEAQNVIVTAGAWTRKLLGAPFDGLLSVTRQTLHWYEAPDPALFTPGRFPTFIWFVSDKLDDYFSGFPIIAPSEGIKMVASREGPDIDHETIDRHVPAEESRSFYDRHVGPNLAGISPKVTNSASCFYTNTPDRGFIIDTHPDMDKVLVVSACSGHGFKHSVGVGEAVAQRVAEGASQTDLSAFRLSRFAD